MSYRVLAVLLPALTLGAEDRLQRYALILEAPPMAEAIPSPKDARSAAAQDHLRWIEAAQQQLRTSL